MTLSGIFRDLLPLQTRMLAEAAWKAAMADEPVELNFVRAHALAYAEKTGCDMETAALRVFSNAEGAYGSNVNQLVDGSAFGDEDELADAYEARKGFAYGRNGKSGAEAGAAAGGARGRRPGLPEPRIGRAGRDHGRPLLRHAGRHQPGGASAPRARPRRSISATRRAGQRQGPHAAGAGGAGDPLAEPQPALLRGAAEARPRGRAPDRGACDQHAGLVGDDRRGGALGLPAAVARPSCWTRRCGDGWRS